VDRDHELVNGDMGCVVHVCVFITAKTSTKLCAGGGVFQIEFRIPRSGAFFSQPATDHGKNDDDCRFCSNRVGVRACCT
jgi:hypothetical protein